MTDKIATAAFFTYLHNSSGYSDLIVLPDGRWAGIAEFLFTHAIIVGRIGDRDSYEDRWCYKTREDATGALESWDGTGEPEGWHRHPLTGRRRETTENGLVLETINQ